MGTTKRYTYILVTCRTRQGGEREKCRFNEHLGVGQENRGKKNQSLKVEVKADPLKNSLLTNLFREKNIHQDYFSNTGNAILIFFKLYGHGDKPEFLISFD